jgi:2-iminobutanoate/2-iminopropanoate deaminase
MLKSIVCALTLVLTAGLPCLAGEKKIIRPKGVTPGGPYSPGILTDGTLYAAGQVGRDAAGKYPAEFEAEVRQTLDNVGAILKEAGMDFSDVVSVQVYLTDIGMFQRMNAVYMTYFKDPRPARTTVGIASLVPPARIEITVTARK